MAAPTKQASSSRWGSFLQQAVAGVESRLDNILAEGEGDKAAGTGTNTTNNRSPAKNNGTLTPAKVESANVSRNSSTSRNPDRLQERLAKAVAAKNLAQKGERPERPDSLALGSAQPSRTNSPAPESPRASLDLAPLPTVVKDVEVVAVQPVVVESMKVETKEDEVPSISVQPGTPSVENTLQNVEEVKGLASTLDSEPAPRISTDSTRSSRPRDSIDSTRQNARTSTELSGRDVAIPATATPKSPAEYESLLQQIQSDFEAAELQRQDEVHEYVEKIDTLLSKLQYLARENAESARKLSGAAASGSLEKKLADKDEQVALLMEEGQKLSKKELTLMTTIKKLRIKGQESSKEVTEAKSAQEKAERDFANLTEKLRRAEASEKRLLERQKQIPQLQKEKDVLRTERDAKDTIINDLRKKLEQAATQEKQAESKATQVALETERKRVSDLEDDLANAKIEKNLVHDRAQAQIKELREKIDKDAERAKIAEFEARTEQQMLESKLEVMRARAEEASSGATGDAQAKLLRQIETLQTQYAVASENWQGIEASLLARATNLEKERDEATKREADIRRKAREVALKAKRNEDELEETRSQLPTFQQDLADHKLKLANLQKHADEAEAALIEARAAFEQEKASLKAESHQRLEEERQRFQEELSLSHHQTRADSPVTSTRRGLTSEYLGLQNLQIRRAARSVVGSDVPSPAVLSGRRPSAHVLVGRTSGNGTPIRQDSLPQSMRERENGDTPVSIMTDHDDFFDHRPSSPLNDMVSASTAGAGPSVQLVERMSSAVRRLESEKVAMKEDLARLSAQRDEARAEIVKLMQEVEKKREGDEKVKALEKEVEDLGRRYQTTLEMLGEKSEEVEELRGDIEDLKGIYRDLVQRTLK